MLITSTAQQDSLKAYYDGKNLNKYAGIVGVSKKEPGLPDSVSGTAQAGNAQSPAAAEQKVLTLQPVRTLAPAKPKVVGPSPMDEIKKCQGLAPLLLTSEAKCILESVQKGEGTFGKRVRALHPDVVMA